MSATCESYDSLTRRHERAGATPGPYGHDLPDLTAHLAPADALLIVPPFHSTDATPLGVHILQACARQRGYEVRILYANLLLASQIGTELYEQCVGAYKEYLGERFFAAAAYGRPAAVYGGGGGPGSPNPQKMPPGLTVEAFAALAGKAEAWCDQLAKAIAAERFPVVGATTTFQQTAAGVAILQRVKALCPETVTIMGGANCETPMGQGLKRITPGVDFIFAGESEDTFPDFLDAVQRSELPPEDVIVGHLCDDLDAVATPDFREYYAQLETFAPDGILAEETWLSYEMSRGCAWGEKSPCTFCGQCAAGRRYRQKSADRVIDELRIYAQQCPTRRIVVSDNLMPREHFKTLLPRLQEALPGMRVFHEVRANVSLAEVALFKQADFIVQPGIEALSTPLLKLMRKGTTARQNIDFLRYTRCLDVSAVWNLLCGFPEDKAQWYEETISLLPLIVHLQPPATVFRVRIDRYSVYHDTPEQFGIRNVKPAHPYLDLLPIDAPHAQIAYHFECDWDTEFTDELEERLRDSAEAWYRRWADPSGEPDDFESWRARWTDLAARPVLEVSEISDGQFLLKDTRGLPGCAEAQTIDKDKAIVALAGQVRGISDEDVQWAIDSKACAQLGGRVLPLATASFDLLRAMEARARARPQA